MEDLFSEVAKKAEKFLLVCRLCGDKETPGDNSSNNETLRRFSSALTHKEKVRGSETQVIQQYSLHSSFVSCIEADSKCHPC